MRVAAQPTNPAQSPSQTAPQRLSTSARSLNSDRAAGASRAARRNVVTHVAKYRCRRRTCGCGRMNKPRVSAVSGSGTIVEVGEHVTSRRKEQRGVENQQEREPLYERRSSAHLLWRHWTLGALGAAPFAAFLSLASAQSAASESKPAPAPAASGGKASHGALAMDGQAALLAPWVAPTQAVAVPKGVYAQFWRRSCHRTIPAIRRSRARPEALLRHRASRRTARVACATCHDVSRGFTDQRAGLGGHRRQARPAQRADHAERALLRRRSSGTAARRRSRSRRSCRS